LVAPFQRAPFVFSTRSVLPHFFNAFHVRHAVVQDVARLSHLQNNLHIHQYNGYSVCPSAHRLPDGWFAANLLLIRSDARSAESVSYKFHALDYFDNEIQALGHASTWARGWVDSRG
jgi:hypothetical protein